MDRKQFLRSMLVIPFMGTALKLHALRNLTESFSTTEKMPVLFMGHGSPMNAIEENEFVQGFRLIGESLPRPTAILCISAHWETHGTYVTAMSNPPTIHDFGGFPQELFNVEYPAPGSPQLAVETQKIISSTSVKLTDSWGLDHGAWTVIKHLYPDASIPVIQMSIDHDKNALFHYQLGKELATLRKKGVLIIGSGNMVHNLRMVAWEQLAKPEFGFEWAKEADEKMKKYILQADHQALINYHKQGKSFDLSIPTPEHYFPLLYALSLQEKDDKVEIFNSKLIGGSLSMTSVKISI